MYIFFVKALLVSAILFGIVNIVLAVIGKRPQKAWKYVFVGLIILMACSVIGMVLTK